MEAATAAPSLLARARAERFQRECERLRPLGEAYAMRRFGNSMSRADAEDAVAEVLMRLHRMAEAGTPPQNLRATFFASVRNQAIDQLRSRAARPTVGLEAAADAEALGPAPSEWAEHREDAARVQEALGRMRGNYREAIMLRFGLGLSVPEIAEYCEISLPAAKKLVLRATAQARKRMQALEEHDFCPQMRELAQRAVLEKELSGVGEKRELVLLRAHLSHCGSCKSFVATMHERLHDLGAAAVFGLAGAERLSGHLGILDSVGQWGGAALDGAQAGGARLRHVAYKAGGLFSGSDGGSAGALLSGGQKIAAVCTAGAASAACLLSGAVGPGIATLSAAPDPPAHPAAQVREQAPEPISAPVQSPVPAPPSDPEPSPPTSATEDPPPPPAPSQAVQTPAPSASPSPPESEPPPSEFGIEGSSTSSPAPEPTPAPAAPVAARAAGGSGTSEAAEVPAASGAGSSGSSVGFHG